MHIVMSAGPHMKTMLDLEAKSVRQELEAGLDKAHQSSDSAKYEITSPSAVVKRPRSGAFFLLLWLKV